jgi:hypothetical protein
MAKGGVSKASKMFLFFLVLLTGMYLAAKRGYISLPWDRGANISPIYDTDDKNDRYIKKDLSLAQMKVLDRVLNEEQRSGGQRLPGSLVRELAGGDKAVIGAYGRWRKCCDLMRSSNDVIYPRERGQ